MNLGSKRIRVGLFAAAILVVTPVLAHHTDSIYPANTPHVCGDGQMELGRLIFCLNEFHTPMTYFVEYSITDQGWMNITGMMAFQYEPTDLTTLDLEFFGGPVYTGANQTDIIYYHDTSLPLNVLGHTYCDQPISLTRCGQQYVAVASSTPDTAVICHETGHAFGLLHGVHSAPQVSNNDVSLECMRTPASGVATLGAHNASQINGEY